MGYYLLDSETPFKWHFTVQADDGPKLYASLVALRFFRGSAPVLIRNPLLL